MPTEITQELQARLKRVRAASRISPEIGYLIVAVSAGIIAIAVWWNDGAHGAVSEGIFDVLRIIAAIAGCGYFVRTAESRLARMLAEQLANADRTRQGDFAAGYIAGIRRDPPTEGMHLRLVD